MGPMLSRERCYMYPTPAISSILLAKRKGRLIPSRLEFRFIAFCNFPSDYFAHRTNRSKHRATVCRPGDAFRLYLPHLRYACRIGGIDSSRYSDSHRAADNRGGTCPVLIARRTQYDFVTELNEGVRSRESSQF